VAPERAIELRIRRQDRPDGQPYWHTFRIPWAPQHNVISALLEIRRRPVTVDGQRVSAPAFDAACLEEVCGSCPMRINGEPRMACTALVDALRQPIVLEPLAKFPVVRDLSVDRSRMFDALKRIEGWIPIDGTYDLGPGPRIAPERQQLMYALDRCITCGLCLEVCPQVHQRGGFIGAAAIGQALLFNLHPTGRMHRDARLATLMGPHGIADCGNAQNCVEVCPKEIPLTYAIGEIGRQTTVKWVKDIFQR
jgi:succinate dehydrogenase / fumarate reductase iron-sulfur subunit